MTVTPPRETGGAVTRSARNRNRRRLNASSSASVPVPASADGRHGPLNQDGRPGPLNQVETAPARRRGRHAADEPEAVAAAGLTDVEFPAPAWDPWTTGPGQALPPPGRTDPLDGPAFRSEGDQAFRNDGDLTFRSEGDLIFRNGDDPAVPSSEHRAFRSGEYGLAFPSGDSPVIRRADDPAARRGDGATALRGDGATALSGEGPPARPGEGPAALRGEPEPEEPQQAKGWIDTSERERAWEIWAGTTGDEQPLPGLDEDPAAPETTEGGFRDRGRWAHARRTHSVYLKAAVVRCGLYLGPLCVAVAAAGSLSRVAWPVTALMLFFGWTAAQGLTSVGVSVAARGGPSAAARVVAAGFAAMIGLWCALVWVAPAELLGADPVVAATIGACGLLTLATVTAALVTRAESSVAAWFMPCWLLAAAAMADAAGIAEAALIPVETMLPAAIVATAVRAFRPAVLTAGSGRIPAIGSGRIPRLTRVEHQRGVAHAFIGAAQAICVTLLWRGGPAMMPLPAALPLLLAVPLMEGLIGWHTARLDAALDSAETSPEFDRHARNVTVITLAALVPPFAAGCGLLVAAYRLPHGFANVPGAAEAVLALAAATLLSGVFAVTFLLAARSRYGIAATLAGIPPAAATVLALFASPAGLLPAACTVLAATHLAGLLIVALTAADLRRTP
ncbi:hypothetical protein [Actinoplanes derwentensis]|uniref:Uncharacterized protein n=1 Tax=Actinoplanes derwentensis TaxID=113562 RepID=A0A1H2D542_9ACTN|nr:hypothetical protein [Actinoplanes derwentensis]GID87952.1 hypothetical protein Ade03nite_68760 [Actinoplanes derwentensis]SDT77602.1 hypothetical protein SAMN04489716_8027 [Actinoplanes derwentensis]